MKIRGFGKKDKYGKHYSSSITLPPEVTNILGWYRGCELEYRMDIQAGILTLRKNERGGWHD